MNKIDICRDIVKEGQNRKVTFKDHNGKNRKVILDLFSASVIVKVFDAVNDSNKEKLLQFDWFKLQRVCFAAIKN